RTQICFCSPSFPFFSSENETRELSVNVEVEEHSLGDLNEPTSYKAAMLDSESNKWIDAMNAEIQFMMDDMVWVLVDLPPGSRLVAKGYTQLYGVDYEEMFSPIADIRAIRILISIAAYYDYEIWQMKVKRFDEEIKRFGFAQNLDEPCVYQKASGSNATFLILNTKDMFLVYGGNPSTELRVECFIAMLDSRLIEMTRISDRICVSLKIMSRTMEVRSLY
ncbi:retrotransposon protein, putative, ty1-copia subclass, partial [Tanacetum coccineum]